jgi:hypothetical protein
MKNVKKVIVAITILTALATAAFMYIMKSMPNIFDWDLDDE